MDPISQRFQLKNRHVPPPSPRGPQRLPTEIINMILDLVFDEYYNAPLEIYCVWSLHYASISRTCFNHIFHVIQQHIERAKMEDLVAALEAIGKRTCHCKKEECVQCVGLQMGQEEALDNLQVVHKAKRMMERVLGSRVKRAEGGK